MLVPAGLFLVAAGGLAWYATRNRPGLTGRVSADVHQGVSTLRGRDPAFGRYRRNYGGLEERAIAAWSPPAGDITEGAYWMTPHGVVLENFVGGHDTAAADLDTDQQGLLNAGFVRIRAYGEDLGIQTVRPLTEAQRRTLLRSSAMRYAADANLSVDISAHDGTLVDTVWAPQPVTPAVAAGTLLRANRTIESA